IRSRRFRPSPPPQLWMYPRPHAITSSVDIFGQRFQLFTDIWVRKRRFIGYAGRGIGTRKQAAAELGSFRQKDVPPVKTHSDSVCPNMAPRVQLCVPILTGGLSWPKATSPLPWNAVKGADSVWNSAPLTSWRSHLLITQRDTTRPT